MTDQAPDDLGIVTGEAVAQSLRSAAGAVGMTPDIYLYTSDPSISRALPGFDGCFSKKGDDEALLAQVDAAFRLRRVRAAASRPRGT